jgi:hypothetical protein
MSDKLYVVRLTNGGSIQCTIEAKARAAFAKNPGSTLGWQPFPSPVKMPWIDGGDYTFAPAFDGDGVVATYTPLGVSGWGDDAGEAYSAMLRAIRAHLERETETVIA